MTAPWLRLGRWLVVAFVIAQLGLTLAGIALFPRYAASHAGSDALTPNIAWTGAEVLSAQKELGWPATTTAWLALARDLMSYLLVYPVLFLLLRRKVATGFDLYVALVFALTAPLSGTAFLPLFERLPGLATVASVLGAISWQIFFILFYLFPSGRPVPSWTRWLVWAWGVFVAFQIVTLGQLTRFFGPLANPIQVPIFGSFVLIAIASQVYRYFRRSDALQRQQTKWVVYVLAVETALFVALLPFSFRPPDPARMGQDLIVAVIAGYFFGLLSPVVVAAIGLAMLRYRLWDIDVTIRRTLVYSLLTAVLALTYLGSVVVLQNISRAFTGQGGNSLVTVVSTLAIAALFVPLRGRVQGFIDHRFFRRKYDATQILARFGANVRDQVDLEQLTGHVLGVVDATMQPAMLGLWLKPPLAAAADPWRSVAALSAREDPV